MRETQKEIFVSLKIKTKETDGFVKYKDGKKYDIFDKKVENDAYKEIIG